MFMGDFSQFPPINDTLLYSINIQPIFIFTKLTQKNHRQKLLGKLHLTK
jgi:hypothetical protein